MERIARVFETRNVKEPSNRTRKLYYSVRLSNATRIPVLGLEKLVYQSFHHHQ